jgi:SAM-dependent methyltransferase
MQQPSLEQLKEGMRATWAAGDFGRIAQYASKAAEEFVDRLAIAAETEILDVACGTGNLAIPAARRGAHVTGIDIAVNLLQQARQRADAEGLRATFDEGDAEELPYTDARFDLVMSMFGAMFAPRPERVSSELARVCRSGGRIAMANWTPNCFPAEIFRLTARYIPPPDLPAPSLWGDEQAVRQRLGPYIAHLETAQRTIAFDFPFSPRETVQFFREYFGPIKMAFARLDTAGQGSYAADLEELWSRKNEVDSANTLIHTHYLEVTGTRT